MTGLGLLCRDRRRELLRFTRGECYGRVAEDAVGLFAEHCEDHGIGVPADDYFASRGLAGVDDGHGLVRHSPVAGEHAGQVEGFVGGEDDRGVGVESVWLFSCEREHHATTLEGDGDVGPLRGLCGVQDFVHGVSLLLRVPAYAVIPALSRSGRRFVKRAASAVAVGEPVGPTLTVPGRVGRT